MHKIKFDIANMIRPNPPFMRFICSLLVLFGISTPATYAENFDGGILTYTRLTGNTYRFTMVLYEDCSGASLHPFRPEFPFAYIYMRNRCGVTTIGLTLQRQAPLVLPGRCNSPTNACNGGTGKGLREFVFEANYTLPFSMDSICNLWDLTWGAGLDQGMCCHSSASNVFPITMPPFYLRSFLNNHVANGNSSGELRLTHRPFYSTNWPIEMRLAQPEPDGDSLVYSLITPYTSFNTLAVYQPGISASQPFLGLIDTVRINQTDGSIRFRSNTRQISLLALQRDEYRSGQLVGSIALLTKAWIDSIHTSYYTDSVLVSGCDSVVIPNKGVYYTSTFLHDTILSATSCDTLRVWSVVVDQSLPGGINGPDTVLAGVSQTYQVQNPVPGYLYYWQAQGGVAVPDTGLQTQVTWFNAGTGQLRLYNASPVECLTINTLPITIAGGVSVSENELKPIRVFPNPAQDKLYIQSEMPLTGVRLLLLNGQLVKEWTNASEYHELDVSAIAPGLYLLMTETSSGRSHYRLLIQR